MLLVACGCILLWDVPASVTSNKCVGCTRHKSLDASIDEYNEYASLLVPFLGGRDGNVVRRVCSHWCWATIMMSFITWCALCAPHASRRRIHPHHFRDKFSMLLRIYIGFDLQWIAVQRPIQSKLPVCYHCLCYRHLWQLLQCTVICHITLLATNIAWRPSPMYYSSVILTCAFRDLMWPDLHPSVIFWLAPHSLKPLPTPAFFSGCGLRLSWGRERGEKKRRKVRGRSSSATILSQNAMNRHHSSRIGDWSII